MRHVERALRPIGPSDSCSGYYTGYWLVDDGALISALPILIRGGLAWYQPRTPRWGSYFIHFPFAFAISAHSR